MIDTIQPPAIQPPQDPEWSETPNSDRFTCKKDMLSKREVVFAAPNLSGTAPN